MMEKTTETQEMSPSINFYKTVLLTCPILINKIIDILDSIVYGICIAYFGKIALAAAAIIQMLGGLSYEVSARILDSVSIIVPQSYGKSKPEEAGAVMASSIPYILIGSILSALVIIGSYYVLGLLKVSSETIQIVSDFYAIYLWMIPLRAMLVSSHAFMVGINRPWSSVAINLCSIAVFFISLYGLLFTSLSGSFSLGTALAISICTKNIVSAVLTLATFLGTEYQRYKIFSPKYNTMRDISRKIFDIGFPIFKLGLARVIYGFLSMILASSLGNTALTVQYVTQQLLLIPSIIIMAFTPACKTTISYLFGRNEFKQIKESYNHYLFTAFSLSSLIVVISVALSNRLTAIYLDPMTHNDAFTLVRNLIAVCMVGMSFNFVKEVTMSCLYGIGETKYPAYANIIMGGLSLAVAFVLASICNFGITGLIVAQTLGVAINFILAMNRWLSDEKIKYSEDESFTHNFVRDSNLLIRDSYCQIKGLFFKRNVEESKEVLITENRNRQSR